MKKLLFLSFCLILFLSAATAEARPKDNLYSKLSKKSEVKVFVDNFLNSSGDDIVDVVDLRSQLCDLLKDRKSVNFVLVDQEANSDISIKCSILNYKWSEDDPIDMIYATGALAYDLVVQQNYAYTEADFVVYDSSTKRELWSDLLKVDITKSDMDAATSVPLLNNKTAKSFIKRSFSKRFSKKSKSSPI